MAALAADEVAVWHRRVVPEPASASAWESAAAPPLWAMLSSAEREAAGRLRRTEDRARAVVARVTVREICAQLLDIPAESVPLAPDALGKPQLAGRHRGALQVNVSHAGTAVLVAASRDRAVGVDIEPLAVDAERVAMTMFAAAEREALLTADPATRARIATSLWTRKEAYLKAVGSGLRRPLDSFAVTDGVEWLDVVEGYAIGGLEVPDGYVASVCASGRGSLPTTTLAVADILVADPAPCR